MLAKAGFELVYCFCMKTIKKHSHEQRIKIAKEMVSVAEKRFGKNLEAVDIRGSTARNTDGPYSDLEMFAFIMKMPNDQKYKSYGKDRRIINGLLIELIWVTKKNYIKEVKDISSAWFGSGSDKLLALTNRQFVKKINSFKPANKRKRCLDQAAVLWDHLQESATKSLNAAESKNAEAMAMVLHDTFSNILKMVSFLNAKPYTTFSKLVEESRKMKYRPADLELLTRLILDGKYRKFSEIKKLLFSILGEFEELLLKKGYALDYDSFENR